jgi:hypothetical protein
MHCAWFAYVSSGCDIKAWHHELELRRLQHLALCAHELYKCKKNKIRGIIIPVLLKTECVHACMREKTGAAVR